MPKTLRRIRRPQPELSSVVAMALCAALGCVRSPSQPAAAPASSAPQISPVIVRPYDEAIPAEKFERALAALAKGDARAAAEQFDDIARDPRARDLALLALYDAGIAWEQANERELGLERFQLAMQRAGQAEVGRLAALRTQRLLAYLERWSALATTADVVLARSDLSAVEQLEAYAAKALAVVEVGDADGSERYIAKGRDLIDSLGLGQGGKLPDGAALVMFALGEMRRLRSERIVFVPLPAHFADALEQRCQGLLDAQNAYTEAMRGFDLHWVALSGYRVGQLYDRLYRDLMQIPTPRSAESEDQKLLFRGAMQLRYRVLLDKGLKMLDHTLMLAERTGLTGVAVERTREAKAQVERVLREQKASLAALPYTEHDLERALQELGGSTGANPGKKTSVAP